MGKKTDNTTDVVAEATGDLAGAQSPTRFKNIETTQQPYVIATKNLYAYGVRAHVPGSRVPVSNVETHGWQDGVVKP